MKSLININIVGMTDVGLKRKQNEDEMLIDPNGAYCLVADGMGGAAAGKLASKIFSEHAKGILSNDRFSKIKKKIIRKIYTGANDKILNHIKEFPQHEGMGCTADLLCFNNNNYLIGHVGDSRTYLFRNNTLQLLTKDHSYVQDQVDSGKITSEEARIHPNRNVINKAVGIEMKLVPDIINGKCLKGDIFIVCSDGLTDMIDDFQLYNILSLEDSCVLKLNKLIQSAKYAGGKDNITVIIAHIS